MTNIEIVMTPDEDKAIITAAYIRRDKGCPGHKYVIYLDLPFHFTDTKELEQISKWLDIKRSNVTKRFYLIGYLPPEYLTYYNGLSLDDGDEYFIPALEVDRREREAGIYSFHVLSEDVHLIRRVGRTFGLDDISVVYNDAHAGKSDKNKEETKMATTYDAKTGKRYYDYTQASAAYRSAFGIDKVVYSPPATIVFWKDGSKTVVKCSENDVFDPLAGIAFAVMRKVYGKEYRRIEKHAKEYEKLHPPVDISAMDVDALDDLADAALAGYVMSDKEYEAVVDGAPAEKVGETTIDDSELKPMSFSNIGGEMVQKALEDLAKDYAREVTDDGTHE